MATDLEILHYAPVKPCSAPPLLFVHGAFMGAWCWERMLAACAAAGYDAWAVSLSGHGNSPDQAQIDRYSIADYVADVATVVAQLPESPILIGHSMGGFVIQQYLGKAMAPAVALLATVPPYGLAGSAFYMSCISPHLLLFLQRFQTGIAEGLNLEEVRSLLFSPQIPESELESFAHRAQPESAQALMEMNMPHPWAALSLPKLPALVLGAEEDRIIPHSDILLTAHAFGAVANFVPQVGHALMLDEGWQKVQEELLFWLSAKPWAH